MAKPDPQTTIDALAAKKTGKPYLGDYKVVHRLLGHFSHAFLQGTHATGEDLARDLDQAARELAEVFLGKDADFSAPPWNSPGQIDLHVAKRCGVDSDDPIKRVAGGLVALVAELLKLGNKVEQERLTKEQWQAAAKAIMDKYVRIFMGIPRAI